MDLEQLRQILELVKQHDLSEFEIEHEGLRLKIRKGVAGTVAPAPSAGLGASPPPAPPAATDEIDSEFDGEVVNVYVENGQPVQYGERLFAIRTL
jgi:acetyl-CoA carboxylase biotin carboxyl carrier protein